MWRALAAAVAVALAGGAALWTGTSGGTVFTAETARRADIAARPRSLPATALVDRDGVALDLTDYLGAPLLAEFVYATCPDICITLGTAFEQIDAEAPPGARLLSISFDPRDDAERLGWFADRHGALSPRWRVAAVPDPAQRKALLKRAEVIVIPDELGGYVHNAGLYLIDAQGRLVRVFDPEDAEGALAALEHLAG